MAKTRAQRKAEQRRKAALQEGRTDAELTEESRAQHDTQVGETGYEIEAELAERGVPLDELTGKADAAAEAPAPSRADVAGDTEAEPLDKISRRAQRQAERSKAERQGVGAGAPRRRPSRPRNASGRGDRVLHLLLGQLKRVQWPDRETLIQASAITLVFITIMAAYLGVLDAVFNGSCSASSSAGRSQTHERKLRITHVRWYVINTYSGHENKVRPTRTPRRDHVGIGPRARGRRSQRGGRGAQGRKKRKMVDEADHAWTRAGQHGDDLIDRWGLVKNTLGATGFDWLRTSRIAFTVRGRLSAVNRETC